MPGLNPENSLQPMLDRIATGTHTDADLEALRRALLVGGQGNVVQVGKYNVQIGKGQDIRIGDTVYHGLDADAIQTALRAVLDEIGWQRRFSVPFQAPPLPAHFVPRPDVTDALTARLLSNAPDRPGVLVVSAIHGLGGIGKSILAAALCHSPEVQARFPDGILWATLGQKPEQLPLLTAWIQALGDYQVRPTTSEAASTHLRTLLHDKAALLMVDDVWDAGPVRPFLVGGPRCRVLITTRRADVTDEVGADLHELNVMTPEQSLALLAARLGRALENVERPDALRLAKAVGHLPLALELAAVRVQAGAAWADLQAAIEAEVVRLEVLEGPRGRRLGENRLEASLNLSLDALRRDDEAAWRAFAWLGVLPEDAVIAAPMAASLWEVSQAEATDLLELLWNDSLLLPRKSLWLDGRTWPTYQLHDLLHDLARRLVARFTSDDPHIALSEAHAALLRRYRAKARDGQWHTLPDDGYIHRKLIWHMQRAGQHGEIWSLFKEQTAGGKSGWFEACDRLGQTAGYLNDVMEAWKLSHAQGNRGQERQMLGFQAYCALILSSIRSLAANLPPVLVQQLVCREIWTSAQGLAYARQIPNLASRARAVAMLISILPISEQESVTEEVLALVPAIDEEDDRATVLQVLIPCLSPRHLDPCRRLMASLHSSRQQPLYIAIAMRNAELDRTAIALSIIEAMPRAESQTKALVRVAPYLSGDDLQRALTLARTRPSQIDQVTALTALLPRLDDAVRDETARCVLHVAENLVPNKPRMERLIALLPHLSNNDRVWAVREVLRTARSLVREDERLKMLVELHSNVLGLMQNDLIDLVVGAMPPSHAGMATKRPLESRVFSHETDIENAVTAALAIENPVERLQTLDSLAPQMSRALAEVVLSKLWLGGDKAILDAACLELRCSPTHSCQLQIRARSQPESVHSVAQGPELPNFIRDYLDDLSADQILNLLLATSEDHLRMNRLWDSKMRAHDRRLVAESLRSQLLGGRTSGYEMTDGKTVGVEAKMIDGLLRYSTESEWNRVQILLQLIRRLPNHQRESIVDQVLNITLQVHDSEVRAGILVQLMPNLPLPFRRQIFARLEEIESPSSQLKVLSAMSSTMPDDMLRQAASKVLSIPNSHTRREGIASMAFAFARLPAEMLLAIWEDILLTWSGHSRSELVLSIECVRPIIEALGGRELLEATAGAIEDVSRWWP